MSCSLDQIQKDSLDYVKERIQGKAKSITVKGNVAYIRWDQGSNKVTNRDIAFNVAKAKQETIRQWALEKFGKDHQYGWTEINTSYPDTIVLNITFPQSLYLKYKLKEDQRDRELQEELIIQEVIAEEQRQLEQEAQERENQDREMGIDEFGDSTLDFFEEIPTSPTSFVKGQGVLFQTNNSSIESLQEGLDWLKTVFPNVEPELVDGLINGVARGSYDTLTDLIQLSKEFADKGTIKHEIVHKVLNSLLPEKREEILNAGLIYFNLDTNSSDLTIEEKIAELAETSSDEELPKTILGRFIQSFKNLLRNLFFEKDKIEQFIRDINQGRYSDLNFTPVESEEKYQLLQSPQQIIDELNALPTTINNSLLENNLRKAFENIKSSKKSLERMVKKLDLNNTFVKVTNDLIEDDVLNILPEMLASTVRYFDNVHTQLQGITRQITDLVDVLSNSNKYEDKVHLLNILHQVRNIQETYEEILTPYETAIDALGLPSDHVFKHLLGEISKQLLTLRKQASSTKIAEAVAPTLANFFRENYSSLTKQAEGAIQELEVMLNSPANSPRKTAYLNKKIEYYKNILNNAPNEKNIFEAITAPKDKRKPFWSWVEYYFVNQSRHTDPLTALLSNFIKSGTRDILANKAEAISLKGSELLAKVMNVNGVHQNAEKQYEGFFEDRTINKFTLVNGVAEVKVIPAKTLVSEFDHYSYHNSLVALEVQIYNAKQNNSPNLDNLLNQKEALRTQAERKYTPEYYRVYDILEEDDKNLINSLYEEMQIIKGMNKIEDLTDDTIQDLEEISTRISRLSSLVDEFGNPKEEFELKQALRFKDYRDTLIEKEIFTYEDDPDLIRVYNAKKAAVDAKRNKALTDFNSGNITVEAKDAALAEHERWYTYNTRRSLTDDFYKERNRIMEQLSELTPPDANQQYISDLWQEIFNITRGYRDYNGVMNGSRMSDELLKRISDIEQEIQKLIESKPTDPNLTEAEILYIQQRKKDLLEELKKLQINDETPYWKEKVDALIVAEQLKLEEEYRSEARLEGKTEDEIDNYIMMSSKVFNTKAVTNVNTSEFMINNTIERSYKDTQGNVVTKKVPSYAWRFVQPVNNNHIQITPASHFQKRKVNPTFINQDYDERITVRQSKLYPNPNYSRLSPEKQSILKEITEFHLSSQEGLPHGKLGLTLPYQRKRGLDLVLDWTYNFKTILKNSPQKFKNKFFAPLVMMWEKHIKMQDDDEDIAINLKERDIYRSGVYVPHTRPFDNIEQISSDVLRSIVSFAIDAQKVERLDDLLPMVSSVGKQLTGQKTKQSQAIDHLVRSEFLNEKTAGLGKNGKTTLIERALSSRTTAVASQSLNFNLKVDLKNLVGALHQTIVNKKVQGVSEASILKSYKKAGLEMLKANPTSNKTLFGPPSTQIDAIKMLRFLGGGSTIPTTEDYSKVRNNTFRRWFSFEAMSRFRHTNDLQNALAVMYMLSEVITVEHQGQRLPMDKALELKDGSYQWREDVLATKSAQEKSDMNQQLMRFRAKLTSILTDNLGAYGDNKTIAQKYLPGKVLLTLRGYFVPSYLRKWQDRVNYGTGELEFSTIKSFWKGLYTKVMFGETGFSEQEKDAFKSGAIHTSILFGTQMLLFTLYLLGSDDDDDKTYGMLLLKEMVDEAETGDPLAWTNYTLARIHEPSQSYGKKETFSKAVSNTFNKMGKATLAQPFIGYQALSLFDDKGDLLSFEPYYESRTTERNSKKSIERRHPFYANKPSIVVTAFKLLNVGEPVLGMKSEVANQSNDLFNFKWYMLGHQNLKTKEKKK